MRGKTNAVGVGAEAEYWADSTGNVLSLLLPVQAMGTYPMTTGSQRGCCSIINNYNFTMSGLGKREGSMVDEGEPSSPG